MPTNRHLKTRIFVLAGVAASTLFLPTIASAQFFGRGWEGLCLDPANSTPYSADAIIQGVENDLMSVTGGRSGTVSMGIDSPTAAPPDVVCYPTQTFNFAGGFSFGIPTGTLQAKGADAGMALTMGWDADPVQPYTFFRICDHTNTPAGSIRFGEAGYQSAYVGSSNRYFVLGQNMNVDGADWFVELRARVVGDACQLRWRMNNVGTVAGGAGILFGCSPFQILNSAPAGWNTRTANVVGFPLPAAPPSQEDLNSIQFPFTNRSTYAGFTVTDVTRPLRLEQKFLGAVAGYPKYAKMLWSQSNPWGFQIDTQPDRLVFKDADSSDLLIFGNRQQILQDDGAMNFNLFGDVIVGTGDSGGPTLQMRDAEGRFSRSRIVRRALRSPFRLVPELLRLNRNSGRAAKALGDFFADCSF